MNRLLYILLITTISIIGFSMIKQNDLGSIHFSFANFSFETNLLIFGSALLCCLFVILLLVRLYQSVINVFVHFVRKRKNNIKEKIRQSLSQGLIDYAEGRYEQAEKRLLQYVDQNENRLLLYLTAARAAQQLEAHDRRDEYLAKALIEVPDAIIAINLTKAELQLAHEQNELALATLTQLREISPNHTYVLTLLANTYKYLKDWDNLKTILPALEKYGNLSDASFLNFETIVCMGQLTNIANPMNAGSQPLTSYWMTLPQHLQTIPKVVEHYVKQLIFLDAPNEAEKILRLYLNDNWQESSIILYAELDALCSTWVSKKQLETVEGWLTEHQKNAYLLLALGEICISLSLWGKAKNYLEISIAIKPMPQNHLKLAQLLEKYMAETGAAQQYYRQGLHLLARDFNTEILNTTLQGAEIEVPQLEIVKN